MSQLYQQKIENWLQEILEKLDQRGISLKIVKLKGQGSFKKVYECVNEKTKKNLILKISHGEGNIDLKNEYRNSQKINFSPLRLVKIDQLISLQINEEEFCVGISEKVAEKNLLMTIESRERPNIENSLKMLIDILFAASECDISNFQHLDVKLENIVIKNGDFYLIDFSSSPEDQFATITQSYSPLDYITKKTIKRYDIHCVGLSCMLKILCQTFKIDFTEYQNHLIQQIDESRFNQMQRAYAYITLHLMQNDKLNYKQPKYLLNADRILQEENQIQSYYSLFTTLEIAEFYFEQNNYELCDKYLKKLEYLQNDENDKELKLLYLRIDYYKLLFKLNQNQNYQTDLHLQYLNKAIQLTCNLEKKHPLRLFLLKIKDECYKQILMRDDNTQCFQEYEALNDSAIDNEYPAPTDYNYQDLLKYKVAKCQKNEDFFSAERYLEDILKINQNLYGKASLNAAQVLEKLFQNQRNIYKTIQEDRYERNQPKKEIVESKSIENFKNVLDLECCDLEKLTEQIQYCEKVIERAEIFLLYKIPASQLYQKE
ncbi:kinase domain protein (macronuclear) [Tetrahymena thermophila SB210]|uniref:Kinase domain protein n=1 Tax=Tetrahymena thermophila (strain SB210) TaxID=312017 RepID=Q23ZE2_TETTS|nr:kinase domain protein [Tetrahymena thermophila SB210]EAS01915.2 kinase domain protein [Tetrahymena thermophila SB210]|eukprot:XP_001022160.2 kinase domain protein [Tetrahymena thermophila SB210]